MSRNSSTAKTVLEGLVGRMASGDLPAAIAKSYIRAGDVPSSKWSRCNRILVALSGTADARGFRQWQAVDRRVRRGAKAAYILAPLLVSKKDDQGKETDEKVMVGFRAVPVFRYEDTEGAPLREYEPRELPPLFGLAGYNGLDVRYVNSMGGEHGSISVERRSMTLSTESQDTFLHELVHWYDLRDREDRKHGQDAVQETVAQLGACALAQMYGFDASAYTAEYVSHYAGCGAEDGERLGRQCLKVLDRTCEAIERILEDAAKMEEAGGMSATVPLPVAN